MATLGFLVLFLFVLGLLVIIHEFGHFLAAKKLGVQVEEFAFGFPPRLWAKAWRGTVYAINAVPLGGYVRLRGESGEVTDKTSFAGQSAGRRAVIAVAGVAMNLLLAWALLTLWFGYATLKLPNGALFVTEVLPGTAAEQAGLKVGDFIMAVDGQHPTETADLQTATKAGAGKTVKIDIRRFGRDELKTVQLGQGDAPLGVAIEKVAADEALPTIWLAPLAALQAMWNVVVTTFIIIGTVLGGLIHASPAARQAATAVSGPIGVYGLLAQMSSLGVWFVLRFVGLFSLSLAIFNLLPIPGLDGGRLLFLAIEGVARRKVVADKVEQLIHLAGFALLLSLVILISVVDIERLLVK